MEVCVCCVRYETPFVTSLNVPVSLLPSQEATNLAISLPWESFLIDDVIEALPLLSSIAFWVIFLMALSALSA